MSDLSDPIYLVNTGAKVAILCAIVLISSCIVTIYWFWFLCQMTGNESQNNSQQYDLKVLNHQCEEGCYSVDRNVIKVSCPALVLQEVNELFL